MIAHFLTDPVRVPMWFALVILLIAGDLLIRAWRIHRATRQQRGHTG
jgi:hypothetical protein